MGNICRSPTGEGVFRKLLAERGMDGKIHVDSAGTISYHAGEHPDYRMQRAAARRGYELVGRARQIQRKDLRSFDLIIVMDRDNQADVLAIARDGDAVEHVRLLSEFLGDGWPVDVPDPYYGGAKGFDHVIDMIESACPRILESLLGTNDRDGGGRR